MLSVESKNVYQLMVSLLSLYWHWLCDFDWFPTIFRINWSMKLNSELNLLTNTFPPPKPNMCVKWIQSVYQLGLKVNNKA